MTENNSKFETEITERLRNASSFQTHLANVISGMNHELAPWLGGAANTTNRLIKMLQRFDTDAPANEQDHEVIKFISKVEKIAYQLDQATQLLSMLSSSVKRLQNYSLAETSVKDTINAWVRITLADKLIKSLINGSNIDIDENSLDFCAQHSPMLLSQVILNLAKNSIEHNSDILDTLQVKIFGYPEKKTIVYEDNGKGIPKDLIQKIFSPGLTSKQDLHHNHGLGLSACMDYCISMGASIWAKSEEGKYTRFTIKFERSYEHIKYDQAANLSDEWQAVDEMLKIYDYKQQLSKRQEEELW